jgi:hypothetical protein
VADFNIKVVADTKDADAQLKGVDKTAQEATRPRTIKVDFPDYNDLHKNFKNLRSDIEDAANSIKQFYSISSRLPVGPVKEFEDLRQTVVKTAKSIDDAKSNFGDAGQVIKNSMGVAQSSANAFLTSLVRIGVAMYAVQSAANAVNSAFSGMYKNTIGREVQLRETILKTQTTLASTSKIFKNGNEITDPYQKIVQLTGAVRKNIDSIRERSIELAGVTSNEVIEVFGIVSGQISQIGGGLKEAEDLAINFAAALGTFGIPLYQARQEIGSILRGDITMDSYLAKSLGITNQDIAKAKTQTGGVVKFLEEKLAAAVAGQKIAAQGLSGVVSNIKDIGELIGQNFGTGLLDPLIGGLTSVFNFLFKIREKLFDLSKLAGNTIGTIASVSLGKVGEASKLSPRSGDIAKGLINNSEAAIKRVRAMVQEAFNDVFSQIANIIDQLGPALAKVIGGLGLLAKGLASLKLEQLKAMIGLVNTLAPVFSTAATGLAGFLAVWGKFMELPIVQEFTQITAGMRLLEMTGIMPTIRGMFILAGSFTMIRKSVAWAVEQFNRLRTMFGAIILAIGQMATQVARSTRYMLLHWKTNSKALQALKKDLIDVTKQLEQVGGTAQITGNKMGSLNKDPGEVKTGMKDMIMGFIGFQIQMMLLSAAISLITERISSFKEAADRKASYDRAKQALQDLKTKYADVGDEADEATKRAKAFAESLVDTEYNNALQKLEELRKKLKEIKDLTSGNKMDLGDSFRRVFQMGNPENNDVWDKIFTDRKKLFDAANGKSFADFVAEERQAQLKAAEETLKEWERGVNEINKKNDIQIRSTGLIADQKEIAEMRKALEKEIRDYRRNVENELFQARMQVAQKEIEIFRAAGELRIFQMEQANKKMLEGEEGASRAGIEALNQYLTTKEKGELEIEVAKKELQQEVMNLEKAITDYRYAQEERMAELRKRAADYETKVAKYRVDMARVEGQVRAAAEAGAGSSGNDQGARTGRTGLFQGSTGNSTGPHYHIEGAATEAEARAIFANASALAMTSPPSMRRNPVTGRMANHNGWDMAAAGQHELHLNAGYTLIRFERDAGDGYGNKAFVRGPGGKEYMLAHIANPPQGWSIGGGSQAAGAASAGGGGGQALRAPANDFTTRYLARLSHLEGGYGIHGSAARNPKSNARGYFQLIPSTEQDLRNRGRGDIADRMLSKDFMTAAGGARDYAILQRPIARMLFAQKDAAGLDRILNGMWSSLPGGGEPANPQLAAGGRALLNGGPVNTSGGGASAAAAAAASIPDVPIPPAPTYSDAAGDNGGVQRYTEAVKNLEKAMHRLRALQEALTKAQTKAAFDNIADAMFPQIQLEEYKDNIIESTFALETLAKVNAKAYDPDSMQITIDLASERLIKEREIKELLEAAEKQKANGKLTDKEYLDLKNQIAEKEKKNTQELEEQAKLKREALKLSREENIIRGLIQDTNAIPFDTKRESLRIQADFLRGTFNDDPVRARLLDAEVKIMERKIQIEQEYGKDTDESRRRLQEFAEATRQSALELGTLEKRILDFNKKVELANDMASTYTEGAKTFVGDILRGGDLQEAMNNYLTSIADKFVGMAMDFAFAPVEKMLQDMFKGLLGVSDPTIVAQDSNTEAVTVNTEALRLLTEAINASASQSNSTGTLSGLPGESGVTRPVPIEVVSFASGDTDWDIEADLQELENSIYDFDEALSTAANAALPIADGFSNLQRGLGGAMTALSSIALGVAGIQQMKKGGTYNTLMGLAGIFSGISGIAGMFSPKGMLGGFFAEGGTLPAGKFGIAGERGPELLYSGQPTTIIPAGKTRDLFDATRTSLGSGSAGLGRSAPAAPPRPQTIDVRYESQVINNVEYVSAAQHRKGMQEAARMGQAMAYQGIRSSVPTRKRLGF